MDGLRAYIYIRHYKTPEKPMIRKEILQRKLREKEMSSSSLLIQGASLSLSPSKNTEYHCLPVLLFDLLLSHFTHPRLSPRHDGEKIFRLGLTADIGLSLGKALTGYLCGSTAIIADAAHSVSDVVLSGVALVSYRAANVPMDKEHPYGHGKFETLGALAISGMLLATGCGISWHALELLVSALSTSPEVVLGNHSHGGHHHGIDMSHPVLALTVTIASISIKEGLYWITKRAGEKQGSGLMMANAWHHRSDAISSVVALVGVGGSIFGVPFLDPLAGLVVSAMIFKAGLETGHQRDVIG